MKKRVQIEAIEHNQMIFQTLVLSLYEAQSWRKCSEFAPGMVFILTNYLEQA
jgi:hypothetical protein